MMPPLAQPDDQLKNIRRMIWVYFWLLIFEGALRKWVAPSLSNPLLIIRDPIVIAIYGMAMQRNLFPRNAFIMPILALATITLLAGLVVNGDHLLVTAYGLRANFLHLPLIFLIPAVFKPKDVERIGYAMLVLALPMACLVALQFNSSPDSTINSGIAGTALQIECGRGRIRPAGTFSFSTGMVSFASLLAGFLFFGFFKAKTYPKWLLTSALFSLLLIVACSGSRSTLSSVSLLVITAAAITFYRPQLIGGSLKVLTAIFCAYFVISSVAVVNEGMEVLNDRIEGSGGVKAGMVDRFISSLLPLDALAAAPMLGYGIGMGTNAASGIISGNRGFLLAEGEWDRVILETGPLLGLGYILLRLAMVLHLGRHALQRLREGETLAMLLFGAGCLQLLQGQFAQPTSLGFGVLTAALCLAASAPGETIHSAPAVSPTPALQPVRGRSIYSEHLHG